MTNAEGWYATKKSLELELANACIQRAAMKLGSTDEWTDQASMIADLERRLADIVEAAEYLVENIRERGIHDNWKALARAVGKIRS